MLRQSRAGCAVPAMTAGEESARLGRQIIRQRDNMRWHGLVSPFPLFTKCASETTSDLIIERTRLPAACLPGSRGGSALLKARQTRAAPGHSQLGARQAHRSRPR